MIDKDREMEDMLFETVELETPIDTDTSVKDVISTDENAPSITDPELFMVYAVWQNLLLALLYIAARLKFSHHSEMIIMVEQLLSLLWSLKMECATQK